MNFLVNPGPTIADHTRREYGLPNLDGEREPTPYSWNYLKLATEGTK